MGRVRWSRGSAASPRFPRVFFTLCWARMLDGVSLVLDGGLLLRGGAFPVRASGRGAD
jgi:hypothetical protein